MGADHSGPYFPEPTVPDVRRSRYGDSGRPADWLARSTMPQARRFREFLNRSLGELGPVAAANLTRRLRRDPAFGQVFFELIVGRFLQVLGAEVEHEPKGLIGRSVDWRAMFPDGQAVFVEATSPLYNQVAYLERQRREALLGVIEDEAPAGWWIHPMLLPDLGLNDARRAFRRAVRSLLTNLPDRADYSIENRLRLEAAMTEGAIVLELWPGEPTTGAIAMVSMGAYVDDSSLRVGVTARAKRHQARAFPGEVVLLAIDAPFGGPDLEDFDVALLGQTVMHLAIDRGISGYSFRANGALATQRTAEYAGVLAFGRVGIFGANDPTLYRHPRFNGSLPPELLVLRQRILEGAAIRDVPAVRSGIADGIGFPSGEDE